MVKSTVFSALLTFYLFLSSSVQAQSGADAPQPTYPWKHSASAESLESRILPPEGYRRLPAEKNSFTAWLRGLPLKPDCPPVYLYNGKKKVDQNVHVAVVDIDVGERDLQQCADAVMRLRAEYLRSAGLDRAIVFKFTSGHAAEWVNWKDGRRPSVRGNNVTWSARAAPDASYNNFRDYLDTVFAYAGSASLSDELQRVDDPRQIRPGDVLIRGGHPGHAVIVMDVAEKASGERRFLIAQSYMPAQEIHILRNPGDASSPWYEARAAGVLETPEWTFRYEDLKRFPEIKSES